MPRVATRESSGKVLNALAQNIPWLIGGSADLATSNKTTLKFEGAGDFQAGAWRDATCTSACASTSWARA
jgi:transketolase